MIWLNAKQGKSKALNYALFNSYVKYIIHIDSDASNIELCFPSFAKGDSNYIDEYTYEALKGYQVIVAQAFW